MGRAATVVSYEQVPVVQVVFIWLVVQRVDQLQTNKELN